MEAVKDREAVKAETQVEELERREEVVENAERHQRWHEFAKAYGETPNLLNALTLLVRNNWSGLSMPLQERLLALRDTLKKRAESPSPEPPRDLPRRIAYYVWLINSRRHLVSPIYAEAEFVAAIDSALAYEKREQMRMDRFLETNERAIAQLKRGEAEYNAGKVASFNPEDLLHRGDSY